MTSHVATLTNTFPLLALRTDMCLVETLPPSGGPERHGMIPLNPMADEQGLVADPTYTCLMCSCSTYGREAFARPPPILSSTWRLSRRTSCQTKKKKKKKGWDGTKGPKSHPIPRATFSPKRMWSNLARSELVVLEPLRPQRQRQAGARAPSKPSSRLSPKLLGITGRGLEGKSFFHLSVYLSLSARRGFTLLFLSFASPTGRGERGRKEMQRGGPSRRKRENIIWKKDGKAEGEMGWGAGRSHFPVLSTTKSPLFWPGTNVKLIVSFLFTLPAFCLPSLHFYSKSRLFFLNPPCLRFYSLLSLIGFIVFDERGEGKDGWNSRGVRERARRANR
ncbi:hypothetical protein IE53DRAFT_78227 [Violaceomyces palustris]|uniref:Uncharacterized protein n=1 Tax=Violaceomyces palustris TaxID=1673888 RepID=A0ACD0NY95_9BASI|nr:hypothetical protein IE53DRAFT_78227 [Violaceomyces palustris]